MDVTYKTPIRRFDTLCYFFDINELKLLKEAVELKDILLTEYKRVVDLNIYVYFSKFLELFEKKK